MFEARHMQHRITSGYIQIISDGHQLPAFWAHPEQGSKFPGLVLLHDYWGLTPHMRSQVRRFAEQGYYVIAPDLFNGTTPETADHAETLVRTVGAAAQSYLRAAHHALKTHHKCSDKDALIGWGFGGEIALNAAVLRDDLEAVVCFYGVPPELSLAALRAMSCPLLLLLAGHDVTTPAARIEQIRTALSGNDKHTLVVYDDADHGFFNDARATFHPVNAEDAWDRALVFLARYLEPAPPPGVVPPEEVPDDSAESPDSDSTG